MLNNEVLDEFDFENILFWKRLAETSPEVAEKIDHAHIEHVIDERVSPLERVIKRLPERVARIIAVDQLKQNHGEHQ